MFNLRSRVGIVAVLVVATVAAGCQSTRNPHDHGGALVDEVRPEWKPKVDRAPFSAEYVLYAWHRLRPATRPAAGTGTPMTTTVATATATATRPAGKSKGRPPWEAATEVRRAFVDRGRPIGFDRRGGQLLAVADRTLVPLPPGHYCWHLLPGDPTVAGRAGGGDPFFRTVVGVATVVVVVVVAAGIGWLIYQDARHHHHHDDCGCPDDGVIDVN